MSIHDSIKLLCQTLLLLFLLLFSVNVGTFTLKSKKKQYICYIFHHGASCAIETSASRESNLERRS